MQDIHKSNSGSNYNYFIIIQLYSIKELRWLKLNLLKLDLLFQMYLPIGSEPADN